ncbi:MAG TPA: hypothetical protein VFU41_03260 [Gemmatimonadales bacterium]|nr:hypothetical protein [Gemmatimonadales bacterium]
MPRTLLATLVLIGLAACAGGAEQPPAKAATRSPTTSPTATGSSTTQPGTSSAPAKRKAAAPADTSRRNPLQND